MSYTCYLRACLAAATAVDQAAAVPMIQMQATIGTVQVILMYKISIHGNMVDIFILFIVSY